MVNIVIDNIWTTLQADKPINPDVLFILEREMSYRIKEYSPYKRKYLEYEFSLFEKDKSRYPTGLFSLLQNILSERKIETVVFDRRKQPVSGDTLAIHNRQLREYQNEAVDKAIQAQRGVMALAVGSGKTTVAAGIMSRLNVSSLFVVPSIDLLEQASDEFTKMFQTDIGRIGGGYCDIKKINVATIQTLHRVCDIKFDPLDKDYHIMEKISPEIMERRSEIWKMLKGVELIIQDEAHHMRAESYVNMMGFVPNAYYRFGMSGTPFKYESTDLILKAYSGKTIVNFSASYFIERGFLVKPTIYFLDPNESSEYKYVHGYFRDVYTDYIINSELRNQLIVSSTERLLELGKTVFISVTQIAHGDKILELIEKHIPGIKAEFIQGEIKKDLRKALFDRVRNKQINVLIASPLCDEGVDIPALDAAIIANGGKSFIKTMQRVGRTLRPYPSVENNEKKEVIIVDFYDHVRYLTTHSRKRMEYYEREPAFEVKRHF